MKKYIIGIDSGTTSIKAVAMDIRGNVIHKKDFKLTAICPRQDMYEEDMHEIWRKHASRCGTLRRISRRKASLA